MPPASSTQPRTLPWLPALATVAFGLAIAVGWSQTGWGQTGDSEPSSQPAREVILLLDTSAQAGPEALVAARSAVVAVLDELGPQDLFNVIAFASRPRALYPGSWPASEGSLDKARRFVAAQEAGGERSLLAATQAALAPPAEGYGPARVVARDRLSDHTVPRRVVLLTSRPLEDAELLAPIKLRLPPATRLDLVPTVPAGAELARVALAEPIATRTEDSLVGSQTAPAAVVAGLADAPAGGPGRALLLVALALPLFLGVLGWTVRRGLAVGPVSE